MMLKCSSLSKPAEFALLNWKMIEPDNGVIRWHIVNFTPDMDKYKVILAFTKVFEEFQIAFDKIPPVGRYISLETTDNFYDAHIHYFFVDPYVSEQKFLISDGSEYVLTTNWPFIDGPGGVLAHRPPNLHQIHFDEAEPWVEINKPGGIKLRATALHETGHIFDLDHSENKDSVMAPYYDEVKTQLTNDDFMGLSDRWSEKKYDLYYQKTGIDLRTNKGCINIFGL